MLDQRLVHKINTGRCFAFVGSGPSCEVGYSSWKKLAEDTYQHLLSQGLAKDYVTYQKFLRDGKYPELFRQAELDAGGRENLIRVVSSLMLLGPKKPGPIYDFLVQWPFACYLTTNFDNELSERLQAKGQYYETIRNRPEDFYAIRDGVSNLIVKLHSDLEHPNEVVLTSTDYHKFADSDEGKYFRDKLRAIMQMFDVCIIGHSLSDWDLAAILRAAKHTASPEHPIYMITADFTQGDEREFFERYNVRITSYENSDGTHAKLRRILSVANRFIVPRSQRADIPTPVSTEESEAAAALLIFRRLQNVQRENAASPTHYIGPLILQALLEVADPGTDYASLLQREPLKAAASTNEAVKLVVKDVLVVSPDRN